MISGGPTARANLDPPADKVAKGMRGAEPGRFATGSAHQSRFPASSLANHQYPTLARAGIGSGLCFM